MIVTDIVRVLRRAALAAVGAVILGSCGSGSVGPPPVNDPTKVTILPSGSAVLYSGLPTTFSITGGTGSYIVSSSNQAVIQVSGNIPGNSLTVIPNQVVADTTLTLTARDTGTATPATVTLTVKPGTVNNTITITPSSSQCAPAICSGGDAAVSVTISQGDIPLPARGVRFDVVSGDFRFITSPAGQPETLDLTVQTLTDEKGVARARIRVLNAAPNQIGILQVTDLGSGAYQRTIFFIAQASSTQAGFFAIPTDVTFTGKNTSECGTGTADIFVFGGLPPYTIKNSAPDALSVSPTVVASSGGSFRVTASNPSICLDKAAIAITDAAGRTISITVSTKVGEAAPPALVVSPDAVTLSSCSAIANANVVGGTGSYVASSGSANVMATVSGNALSIRRLNPSGPTTSPVTVSVSDGVSAKTVDVTLVANALGTCPATVTLTSCGPQSIDLGSGTFLAPSSTDANITASILGSILTVRRTPATASFTPPATVTVFDGANNRSVTVNASGAGTGACP